MLKLLTPELKQQATFMSLIHVKKRSTEKKNQNSEKLQYKTLQCVYFEDNLSFSAIKNFMGEPDYRQVRLHWEIESSSVPKIGYNVRYCELQSWGQQRCRLQPVNNTLEEKNFIDGKFQHVQCPLRIIECKCFLGNEEIKQYSTDIKGLRMATKYSFEIKPIKEKEEKEREDRAEGDDRNQNIIVIPTKGCEY